MPINAGSLHFLVGPAIAFLVIGCLAIFMRWAFGSGYGRRPPPEPPAEDGLLTLIATLSRRESALALRAVLSDAGIRAHRWTSPQRCTSGLRASVRIWRRGPRKKRNCHLPCAA